VERIYPNAAFNGAAPDAVAAAVEAGAAAILATSGVEWPEGLLPERLPVVYAEDVDELATRLAAVLFGEFI
jgi:hypothetical protein